jgi:hypothetical protein
MIHDFDACNSTSLDGLILRISSSVNETFMESPCTLPVEEVDWLSTLIQAVKMVGHSVGLQCVWEKRLPPSLLSREIVPSNQPSPSIPFFGVVYLSISPKVKRGNLSIDHILRYQNIPHRSPGNIKLNKQFESQGRVRTTHLRPFKNFLHNPS